MELFHSNGKIKYLGERLKELSATHKTAIVEGFARPIDFRGYTYQGLFKYSFTDVREAFGMRQNGGDFIEFETNPVRSLDKPHVTFLLELAMGNGAAYPQPTGQFDIFLNNEKLLSFTVVKYSTLWETDRARFLFEVKKKKTGALGNALNLDEWITSDNTVVNGLGYLRVPSELMGGEPVARIRVIPVNPEKSLNWIRLGLCRSVLMTDIEAGLTRLSQGRQPPEVEGGKVFFGDLHAHSADGKYLGVEGCGLGSWEENFKYARDVSCLDFFCMSDHDWQMDAADWRQLREMSDEYDQPGRFATIKGFEWTSMLYGHRNVYFLEGDVEEVFDFRTEKHPVRFGLKGITPEDPTPRDLWNWLDKNQLEAITVPHHTNADQFLMSLDHFFNDKYDRLVEIYSCWGAADNTEHEVNLNNDKFINLSVPGYLNRLKFGLIASSDGHDGHPGNASLTRGHRYFLGHHLGSGRAAVMCNELSRKEVYWALKNRHCYAVTGAPIVLNLTVNGTGLGGEVKTQQGRPVSVEATVKAEDNIERVEIIKDGLPIHQESNLGSAKTEISVEDTSEGRNSPHSYYMLKVRQEDGEIAWSSPIFVDQ
jgi:hypothetical protein